MFSYIIKDNVKHVFKKESITKIAQIVAKKKIDKQIQNKKLNKNIKTKNYWKPI